MKKMINVLYSGNGKVFDGVLTSTLSLVRRLKAPRPLRVYLYTMTLTRVSPNYTAMGEEHARFIEKALQKHNPDTKVILCDVTDLYETHLKMNANEGCYCSPYTLLRLLADLTEMPDKLLYLDADIMINRDIGELYDIDVENYEYAAAPDHYGKYLVNPGYINAGVLLFNMKKCRETGLFEKARELIRVKKLPFADQSAIIRSTTKKMRKLLPQKFNDQKFLHEYTVIRHFSKRMFWLPYPHTDNIKQWHVEKVHKVFKYHQFDDILNEYLALKAEFDNSQKTE